MKNRSSRLRTADLEACGGGVLHVVGDEREHLHHRHVLAHPHEDHRRARGHRDVVVLVVLGDLPQERRQGLVDELPQVVAVARPDRERLDRRRRWLAVRDPLAGIELESPRREERRVRDAEHLAQHPHRHHGEPVGLDPLGVDVEVPRLALTVRGIGPAQGDHGRCLLDVEPTVRHEVGVGGDLAPHPSPVVRTELHVRQRATRGRIVRIGVDDQHVVVPHLRDVVGQPGPEPRPGLLREPIEPRTRRLPHVSPHARPLTSPTLRATTDSSGSSVPRVCPGRTTTGPRRASTRLRRTRRPAPVTHATALRIGTWNLDGRWTADHLACMAGLDCDVWQPPTRASRWDYRGRVCGDHP